MPITPPEFISIHEALPHSADEIEFDNTVSGLSATDVKGAIDEISASIPSVVAASESAAGIAELATQAETNTGTDDARIVTPLKLTSFPHFSNTSNPHSVTKAQVGLTNVTDDAQLKRAAADINSFTEKVSPASADLLLIEDSADSFNKKKIQIGNLPAGAGSGMTEEIITKAYTDLDGNTSVTLFSLPARAVLASLHLEVDSAFDGGSTFDGIGIDSDHTMFHTNGVLDATGIPVKQYLEGQTLLSSTSSTPVKIYSSTSFISGSAGFSAGGNLITARMGGALIGDSADAVIAGGNDVSVTSLNTSEEYNGTSWSAGGSFTQVRMWSSTFGTTTAMVIAGGTVAGNGVVDDVDSYNGTSWTSENVYPVTVRGATGFGTQSAGLSVGGQNNGGTVIANVYEFDGVNWSAGTSLPNARVFGPTAGVGTQSDALIYGIANASETQTNETYYWNDVSWAVGGTMPVSIKWIGAYGSSTSDATSIGGYTGSPVATRYTYDGATWSTPGTNLTTARYSPGTDGSSTAAIVAGGYNGTAIGSTEEWSNTAMLTQGNITVRALYQQFTS